MMVLREVTELQDREIKTRGCYLHMRHMDSRMPAFERPSRLPAQRTVHDIYAHDYSRMSAVMQSFGERHRQEMADCAFERPVTATIADIEGAREAEVRPIILHHRGPSCSTVTLHDIEVGILAEPKPMTDFPI
jgi:hypothetical protein